MGVLVRRSRIVRLNTSELSRHIAPLNVDTAPDRIERSKALDGIISMQLFPDMRPVIFRRHNVEAIGDSGYAWVGRVENNPIYYASLIVENGEVSGVIQLNNRMFEIDPVGNGLHRVIELDNSKFPPDHPPGRDTHPQTEGPAPDTREATTRAVSTIRVLVAYTPAALTQAGGKNAIILKIKQSINLANVAYANTGIPMKVALVRVLSTGAYIESNNIAVDLDRLGGVTPGFLQTVRNQREAVAADLVSMFRSSDPNFCGIGYLTDTPNAATTNNLAYHVMNWTCVSNYSFHHEMGHNMGLRHDYYVDPTLGVSYNHGYVNRANACRIRTIMAYNDQCLASGFSCTRVNVFSTGNYVWVKPGNVRCAIGINKAGIKKRMDNTQRLKETRGPISNYR
jgi:hypothetical protein